MGRTSRGQLQRLAFGVALASLIAAAPLAAPAAAQERAVVFQIPPQSLQSALIAYGRTTNRQIIFSSADLSGRQSDGLQGPHEPTAALDLLLAGSGLRWVRTRSGAVRIERGEPAGPPADAAAGNATEASLVSELVVTGSRLPGGKQDLTPVNTYTADAIARSGQSTLTGFLNGLPEVSVGSTGNGVTTFGGQTTVRLRGLPAGATLVLLDGRRLASSGVGGASAVVDLNAFAPDLLERIDIVPTGSSAVYGSDAVGGVVNLVTRKRFSGVGGSVALGFADDYEDARAAIAVGQTFSRGAVSLIASYRRQDSLQGADRTLTANSDFRRFAALGGQDRRQPYCDPGTVFAASGLLSGLGSATAAIPAGAQALIPRSAFADTAGRTNLCNYYPSLNLIPRSEGVSGLLNGQLEVGEDVTLYADVFYSKYDTDNRVRGLFISRLSTPASNAFNPFGQAVLVSTLLPVVDGPHAKSEILRPVVGARGDLGGGWSWDAAVWRNTTEDDVSQIVRNSQALAAALASSDPATALNLFRPATNNPALLESIFTRPANTYRTRQTGADAVFRGPLLDLPAGPLAAALGWEGGREKVDRVLLGSGAPVRTTGRRETYALFLEARVPLFGDASDPEPMLQASLAGRYDHYSDFGGATTPQAALEFRPLPQLSFRAAYSEAFKAPALIQLFAGRTTATGVLFDPKLGRSTPIVAITGGNPDLQPETARTSAFTATWREPDWGNLRVSLTYFTILAESRIVQASAQTILTNEDILPGRVTRGPPAAGAAVGPVTGIDATFLNFGGLKLSGLDFSASLDLPLRGGVLSPRLAATRTLKYTSQITPGAPFVDRLSRATSSDVWAPWWKGTVGLTWTGDGVVASAQGRYISRYLDDQTPPNTNRLGDYWTVDASAEINLDAAPVVGRGTMQGLYARLAVSNLLDRGPKYSNFFAGFVGADLSTDDILGRTVTLTLGKRF